MELLKRLISAAIESFPIDREMKDRLLKKLLDTDVRQGADEQ